MLVLWPFLNVVGYKITGKEIVVMTYGGLRGAIGLSLAMYIARADIVNGSERFKILCVFYVAMTIGFTVLLNGLTIKYLI